MKYGKESVKNFTSLIEGGKISLEPSQIVGKIGIDTL